MPDPAGVPEPVAPPPTGEVAALVAVQSALATPQVVAVARAMSHFGEHAQGWVALSALGALVAPKRRREWLLVGVGAVAAHAAAIAISLWSAANGLTTRRSPSTWAPPAH